METSVTLEPFRADQTEELLRMWRESFEHGVGVRDPHPIEEQRAYLLDRIVPRYDVQVATIDGRMVGFVTADRESVGSLYVRVGCHRLGIGRRMLDWAKEQSGGSLWLYAFARNSVARAFYEAQGFRLAARGFEPDWKLEDVRYQWTRWETNPMTAAANKALMQSIFEELAKGNARPLHEALADDVRWTLTGSTDWSRTYEGKKAVQFEFLAPLATQFATRYTNRAHRFIAEDDLVVVECRGFVTTKSGAPYNNIYCWVCRIGDGKVREVTEYLDSLLVAQVLQPPAGVPG